MSKRNKYAKQQNTSHLLLKNQSDEELINLAHALHEAVSVIGSFSMYDMVLEEAIKRELEFRGYKILETLTIEGSVHKPTNQGKGSDEGEKPSKGKKKKGKQSRKSELDRINDHLDTCPDM